MEDKTTKGPDTKRAIISPFSFPKWLDFLDFLASRLIAVFVVAFWKGTWTWMDEHIYPDEKYQSAAISLLFGPGISLTAMIFQQQVKRLISKLGFASRIVATRLYLYIMAFSAANNWRWLWNVLDEGTGKDYLSESLSLGLGFGLLVISRSLTNLVVCPSLIDTDTDQDTTLSWPTYFKFQQSTGTFRYLADCVFTVLVIGSAITAAWRGWWGLLNLFLFHDNLLASALYSLVISQCLALVLFFLTNPIRSISLWLEERSWILKLAYEDLITSLHFIACVLMWRGEWLVLARHFHSNTRYLLCHFIGFLVLMVVMASSSTLTRNCNADGVLPEGRGTCFDYHYVTRMMSEYQAWKWSGNSICMYLSSDRPEELQPITDSQREVPDYTAKRDDGDDGEPNRACLK